MQRVNIHCQKHRKGSENIANSKKSLILGALAFSGALAFGVTSASADTYTVQSGDTLNKIAKQYSTTVDKIAQDNGIQNVNLIYVNDTLKINEDLTTTSTENNVVVTTPTAPVQQATAPVSTPSDNSSAKEWIAQRESGGSYTAQNGQYIGRYQLSASYLNGDYSPANQEKVSDNYVAQRYGSWDNAKAHWLSNGWY